MYGALPPNVNLAKVKPEAVKAFTRRFKSIATNAQTFSQGQYVNITLDTSTPGSFIDPLQSYLKFLLVFQNTNPFIDYVDFGPAGAQSIIQEFRIYCQGTPIEEILNYNLVVSQLMESAGINSQPYHMFKSNKLRQPVSEVHSVNAIKPPMVNAAGNAMGYQSILSSSIQSSYLSSSYGTNGTNPILMGTNSPYANMITFTCGVDAGFITTPVTNTPNLNACDYNNTKNMANFSSISPLLGGNGLSASASYSNQRLGFPDLNGVNPTVYTGTTQGLLAGFSGNSAPGVAANNFRSVQLADSSVADNSTALYMGTPAMLNTMGSAGMVLPGINGTSVNVDGSSTTPQSLNIDSHPANPLNWPFYMPNMESYDRRSMLSYNAIQDYFMYLSNVKSIPVGLMGFSRPDVNSNAQTIYPDNQYNINSANFKNVDDYTKTTNTMTSSYTCCVPLLSGVLGSLAEKCLPTMLIAPGSFYIQLRLAENKVAFQVSMDPCRRLLGTIRDYIPFGGSIGGLFGQGNFNGMSTVEGTLITPANILPDTINPFATSQSSVNEYITNGTQTWVGANPIGAIQGSTPGSSVAMGLVSPGYRGPTTTTITGGAVTNNGSDPVMGISSVQSITGPQGLLNVNVPIVGDGSALIYSLCGLSFTGERGYTTKIQSPVLGGYNALLGVNLAAASILGNTIQYGQSNSSTSTFASLMFLPYSVSAMEGYWSTISVKESRFYSSQDKYGINSNINNSPMYTSGLSDVLGPSVQFSTTPFTNWASTASPPQFESYLGTGANFFAGNGCVSNGNLYGGGIITPTAGQPPQFGVEMCSSGGYDIYNYNEPVQISGVLTAIGVNPLIFQNFVPNTNQTAIVDNAMLNTMQEGFLPNYNGFFISFAGFTISARIIAYPSNALISTVQIGQVNSGASIQSCLVDFSSQNYISSGAINAVNCPGGYYIAVTVQFIPTSVDAPGNVGFIIMPVKETLNYLVNETNGAYRQQIAGSNLQQGPLNSPRIAQTTLYPQSDVVYNSNNGQIPYHPFQIGNNTSATWQEQGVTATYPYLPVPSLLENSAVNNVNTGSVGRSTLTTTEAVVHPAGIPLPQYLLVNTPWSLKELKAKIISNGTIQVVGTNVLLPGNIVPEYAACYGTFLEHSRAQSLRCFNPSNAAGARNGTNELQYVIRNVEFVGQQIIVPDAVTNEILASATHGSVAIQTTSVKCYQTGVQAGQTQNLLIPAKLASASQMICLFLPQNAFNDTDSQLYNSFSSLCPYGSIKVPGNSYSNSYAASTSNGIGVETPPLITNVSTQEGAFELQLKMGNEYIPQQPITSIQEIIAENIKCGHKLFDTSANINATFVTTTTSGSLGNQAIYNSTNSLYFDVFADNSFCSAFTHVSLLDDQTYINNPNLNYVASLMSTSSGKNTQGSDLWGKRKSYILPIFKPLKCTFKIMFDLDTWSGITDLADTGRYWGNNTITLYMTGCNQFDGYSQSGISNIVMYTIITHAMKLQFMQGGAVVSYF